MKVHKIVFILIGISIFSININAQNIGVVTGYDIPRFVSLKSNDVNLRIGPSTNYPLLLNYIKKNFPVKIINEYENWRRIEDLYGNKGWVHKNLLKGDRYAITKTTKGDEYLLDIYSKPNGNVVGRIGKFNIIKINTCLDKWCKFKFGKHKGWIKKNDIWGIYINENLNKPIYQPIINFFWNIKFTRNK